MFAKSSENPAKLSLCVKTWLISLLLIWLPIRFWENFPGFFQEKPPPRANSAPPRELPGVPSKLSLEKRRGSTVTSRIREREAEFQKQVQDREEQITQLKERLKILSQKLAESKEVKFPRDREKLFKDQKEDGAELQNILKQVFDWKLISFTIH